jgi:hypothetical protein
MSKKRRSQLSARAEVVRLVHERDHTCQFWFTAWEPNQCIEGDLVGAPVVCIGPLDVHEVIPRSAWAGGWLEPDNCRLVCRVHHDWIGDHPAEAHRLGLHGFSWEVGR